MLDEYLYLQQQRRRRARGWNVKATIGPLLCGLALVYFMAVAIVGILAS